MAPRHESQQWVHPLKVFLVNQFIESLPVLLEDQREPSCEIDALLVLAPVSERLS